jgi:hypothetical protein
MAIFTSITLQIAARALRLHVRDTKARDMDWTGVESIQEN